MKAENFFSYAKNSRISGTNPSLNKTTPGLLYSGALPHWAENCSRVSRPFFPKRVFFHNYLRTGKVQKNAFPRRKFSLFCLTNSNLSVDIFFFCKRVIINFLKSVKSTLLISLESWSLLGYFRFTTSSLSQTGWNKFMPLITVYKTSQRHVLSMLTFD